MKPFLPYSCQTIEDDDIEAVCNVLKSDFLTTGAEIGYFEQELQEFLQAPEVVLVNSGTAALDLAWRAIALEAKTGAKTGDKVIVPAVTFLSAASMALQNGFELIFADCDPHTGLMSAETIEQAARGHQNIKAICVVHLNGQFAPMVEIKNLATKNNWKIIEDSSHIFGGLQFKDPDNLVSLANHQNPHIEADKLTPAGSCYFSDFTIFSLHAVKNITTGEGGIITCADKEIANKLRAWRTHGIVKDSQHFFDRSHKDSLWYHEMQDIGANYRMSDIAAALGRAQLKKSTAF